MSKHRAPRGRAIRSYLLALVALVVVSLLLAGGAASCLSRILGT